MALATTTSLREFRLSLVRVVDAKWMEEMIRDCVASGRASDAWLAQEYLAAWLEVNPGESRDEIAKWVARATKEL